MRARELQQILSDLRTDVVSQVAVQWKGDEGEAFVNCPLNPLGARCSSYGIVTIRRSSKKPKRTGRQHGDSKAVSEAEELCNGLAAVILPCKTHEYYLWSHSGYKPVDDLTDTFRDRLYSKESTVIGWHPSMEKAVARGPNTAVSGFRSGAGEIAGPHPNRTSVAIALPDFAENQTKKKSSKAINDLLEISYKDGASSNNGSKTLALGIHALDMTSPHICFQSNASSESEHSQGLRARLRRMNPLGHYNNHSIVETAKTKGRLMAPITSQNSNNNWAMGNQSFNSNTTSQLGHSRVHGSRHTGPAGQGGQVYLQQADYHTPVTIDQQLGTTVGATFTPMTHTSNSTHLPNSRLAELYGSPAYEPTQDPASRRDGQAFQPLGPSETYETIGPVDPSIIDLSMNEEVQVVPDSSGANMQPAGTSHSGGHYSTAYYSGNMQYDSDTQ